MKFLLVNKTVNKHEFQHHSFFEKRIFDGHTEYVHTDNPTQKAKILSKTIRQIVDFCDPYTNMKYRIIVFKNGLFNMETNPQNVFPEEYVNTQFQNISGVLMSTWQEGAQNSRHIRSHALVELIRQNDEKTILLYFGHMEEIEVFFFKQYAKKIFLKNFEGYVFITSNGDLNICKFENISDFKRHPTKRLQKNVQSINSKHFEHSEYDLKLTYKCKKI